MLSFPSLRPLLALALVATASCSLFHRHRAASAPPVEAVRPPEPATPPTAARDLASAMTTVLHLRPEQTARVRQILSATVEQANAARQQYPAQSPQLTNALRRINTASQSQLRQVLGPVAFKQLQAKQAQLQAQMQGRR